MRAASFATALMLASGCVVAAETGFQTVIDSELLGAEELDADDVLEGLAHHPPTGVLLRRAAPFRPDMLDDDRARIRFFYHRKGYFLVEVGRTEVMAQENADDEVIVRYQVREGPRFRVSDVQLTSDEVLPEPLDAYRALLELRAGEGFDAAVFEADAQRLESRLLNQSHFDAKVEPEVVVDRSRQAVVLRFLMQPGAAKRFGSLRVEADFLPEDSVRARVDWREGEPYAPARLRTTEGRMYELDLIGSIRFDIDSQPGREPLDVTIEARESLANELRLGGGVLVDSANILVRGRAAYLRRDFFSPLQQLRVTLLPEYFVEQNRPGFQGSVDVLRDDVFGWYRALGSYGVRYSVNQYEGFRSQPATGGVALERPFLDDRLSLRGEGGVTRQAVSITDQNLQRSSLAESAGLDTLGYAFLRGTVSYDGRDDALSPHRGFFVGFSTDAGRVIRGGRNTYVLTRGQLQGYVPLATDRIVAAARLRAAANLGSSPLPVMWRAFGGGSGHHRGFARRELAPGLLGEDGNYVPVGGEAEALGSFELRFDVLELFREWAGIVVFADVGDVALGIESLELSPPHVAAGAGLRVGTPVGPIRLDAAYRINRQGVGEPAPNSTWAFHFAIGEAF